MQHSFEIVAIRIDEEVSPWLSRIDDMSNYADGVGLEQTLKATDQILWVRLMSRISLAYSVLASGRDLSHLPFGE